MNSLQLSYISFIKVSIKYQRRVIFKSEYFTECTSLESRSVILPTLLEAGRLISPPVNIIQNNLVLMSDEFLFRVHVFALLVCIYFLKSLVPFKYIMSGEIILVIVINMDILKVKPYTCTLTPAGHYKIIFSTY